MDLSQFIKFEPIDITHIVITFGLVLILIVVFKAQLNDFFHSLQDRPITVTMSGSETKIELNAPVTPRLFVEPISNPQGDEQDFRRWEQRIERVNNIEQFQKLGFGDLHRHLSSLDDGELAVINYVVDDSSKQYFNDRSMLKYLSVAAQKVSFIAFYQSSNFVGMMNIRDVVSGLASKDYAFSHFGEKIKSGEWSQFPGLIERDVCFTATPSVKALYQRLSTTGLSAVPLLFDGTLLGLLSHQSISDELYSQAQDS